MSLKVAILLCYPFGGGMYHYCFSLAHSLSKYCKIFFFYPTSSIPPKPSRNMSIIPINFRWGINSVITSIPAFIKVAILLLKIKPDIVHFPSNHILLGVFSKLISRFFPIISTIHDPIFHPEDNIIPRVINRRLLIRSSDMIIVHDNFGKKELARYFPRVEIKVIRLLCIEPILRNLPFERKITEDYILFFGRLSLYKGLEVLMKANRIIKRTNSEIKILIAGSGKLGRLLEKFSNKTQNLIVKNEFIEDKDIPKIFANSLFVVLPYTSATQSGIIPIAFYYKKPVITTNMGGLLESVIHEKNGLIIKANDAESLAESIMKMYKNREKTIQMGIEGFKWMRENISSEKIALKTYKTYLIVKKRKTKYKL